MIRKFLNKLDLKNRIIIIMGIFIFVVVTVFLMIFSRIYYRYEERLFGQEKI